MIMKRLKWSMTASLTTLSAKRSNNRTPLSRDLKRPANGTSN